MKRTILDLKPGETATVHLLECGHHLLSRLHSMGIVPGKKIRRERTDNPRTGPVFIRTAGTTLLALGRGMAKHIIVE